MGNIFNEVEWIKNLSSADLIQNLFEIAELANNEDNKEENIEQIDLGPIPDQNKKLIKNYTYTDLQNPDLFLYLDESITEEELQNLKYINSKVNIYLNIENYGTAEKILNKLLDFKKTNQITIEVKDKEIFNQSNIFKKSIYKNLNIEILYEARIIPLNLYKNTEETMYLFLKPIKERNYSQFEKFIYAYNITKRFKKYKEIKTDSSDKATMNYMATQSRNLEHILFNDYMVCVGYSNMLIDLLNKLGIKSIYQSLNVSNQEDPNQEEAGHARVISHIVDPKYNIDGYYISDPTWDSAIEYDFYNHLALTSKEVNNELAKLISSIKIDENGVSYNSTDIIFSESLNEFYNKIKYIINKKTDKCINDCKTKKQIYETIKEIHLDLVNDILRIIKKLDEEKYNEITSKYKISFSNITENFSEIIKEIANYVVPMTNKKIEGSTIIDAAMVVNKDVLNLDDNQAKNYRRILSAINAASQSIYFPKSTIINETTGKVTYQNEENKFASIYPQSSGKTL